MTRVSCTHTEAQYRSAVCEQIEKAYHSNFAAKTLDEQLDAVLYRRIDEQKRLSAALARQRFLSDVAELSSQIVYSNDVNVFSESAAQSYRERSLNQD
jgi:hypothetical protein